MLKQNSVQCNKQQILQPAKEPPLEKQPHSSTPSELEVECKVMIDSLTKAFERDFKMPIVGDLIMVGDPAMSISPESPSFSPFFLGLNHSMHPPWLTKSMSTDEIMAAAHREMNKHIPFIL